MTHEIGGVKLIVASHGIMMQMEDDEGVFFTTDELPELIAFLTKVKEENDLGNRTSDN